MPIEIITKEDLEQFRLRLLADIKLIIAPQPQSAKKWLKGVEVRKILSISPNTLQNLRIHGQLKYTKIGGSFYYKLEDINQLLEGKK